MNIKIKAFDDFHELVESDQISKDEWNEIRLTGVREYFKKQYPHAHISHTVLADKPFLISTFLFVT